MARIELTIQGSRGKLRIIGNNFQEVLGEYNKNKSSIEDLVGKISAKQGSMVSRKEATTALPEATIQGRIATLIKDDFFQSSKTAKEVRIALKERGFAYAIDRVSIALIRLVRKKYLRRLTERVNDKDVFVYVNP
jgi:hypothetical protein